MLPHSFVVFDLETTGLAPASERIIEIAFALVVGDEIVDSWSSLCATDHPIAEGAHAAHGLTHADLEGAPSFADLIWDIDAWLARGDAVVAHNLMRFDGPFLRHEYKRYGDKLPDGVVWIDSLKVAEDHAPRGKRSLDALADRFGVINRQAHRALADVEALALVCIAMRNAPPPKKTTLPAPAAPTGGNELTMAAAVTVAEYADRLTVTLDQTGDLVCVTDDDDALVIDAIGAYKRLGRDIVAKRKEHTGALAKLKTAIEKPFREQLIRPIETEIARLEKLREPLALQRAAELRAEQRRIEAEAARQAEIEHAKRIAEAERLREAEAAAALDGDAAGAADAAAAAEAASEGAEAAASEIVERAEDAAAEMRVGPRRTERTTARTVIDYDVEIIEEDRVPRSLCSPDVMKIKAALKDDPDLLVAGVMVTPRTRTVTRSR